MEHTKQMLLVTVPVSIGHLTIMTADNPKVDRWGRLHDFSWGFKNWCWVHTRWRGIDNFCMCILYKQKHVMNIDIDTDQAPASTTHKTRTSNNVNWHRVH